ncbi:MAG: ribosomal protein S19 family protein [Candidatus Diapherotrites archaeon]|nr:ribosomal protein S19 family protein [Candidatus Diapherotrites archaeon]
MAKKDFSFRGKAMPELVSMGIEEFGVIAGTRIKRRIKRGVDKKFLKKIESAYTEKTGGKNPKTLRTHLRDFPVVPKMVGLRIDVHNGNSFVVVDVKEKMLGHYLGEFALTRKRLRHGKAGIGATKSSTAITARG